MISSTMLDLPDHRERVRDACLQQGMYPLMMEYLPASAADAIQKSLELVNQADIYVGVFAHRYGFVPPGQTTSITEIEYDRAVERRITRLIFIMGEDHEIKIADVEFEEGSKRLVALKARLKSENIVRFFRSPDELKADVIDGLSRYSRSAMAPIQLSGPQLTLYEALAAKDEQLGTIYLGALTVLERPDIPDYLVMAAHELRELIEKLPRYLDVPIAVKPPDLKGKVHELAEHRRKVVKSHTGQSGWTGEIDRVLAKFLTEIDRFFEWFDSTHFTRRQRAAQVIIELDPSRRALPDSLQQRQIDQWNHCDDYFKRVSHHGRSVREVEFRGELMSLETFLLDRIQPQTVEDFEKIDELIKEGETSD